jgi:altronate hydrolase
VPTVKIATNTNLAKRKPHWIDFNAGQILEDHDFESLDESFFKMIVDTASGEYVAHNEKNGYKEISILKDGVTL